MTRLPIDHAARHPSGAIDLAIPATSRGERAERRGRRAGKKRETVVDDAEGSPAAREAAWGDWAGADERRTRPSHVIGTAVALSATIRGIQ
ncbi:hypothetical protein [Streptomyces sp. NPDC058757]|uniref:hypothetical protein n=1 Tax=unclassified Streptomyces TaxID=2593676 RepID=UPI0036B3647A